MVSTEKIPLKMSDTTRAITSVTVSRTCSLREPSRPTMEEDPVSNVNSVLNLNKRSLSNDKMSSDSMVPVLIYQRGSSLRHYGKTTFPISSPNSNNRHPFKMIKPIETSPRTSDPCVDVDSPITAKVSSQRLKFKPRSQIPSQGGPLIPDHNLMKEPPREDVTYTPRPPLVKRFSSDQDDPSSDIDINLSAKNLRSYQINTASSHPKPPISPTRGVTQTLKTMNNSTANDTEKPGKTSDNAEEDTSEMEDLPNSDCETLVLCNCPVDVFNGKKQRSSLRKGSDSPIQSEAHGRDSPSPTKTVKWNLNTEVKKIPRSRSLNGKFKYRPNKCDNGRNANISLGDQKLIESHEVYIGQCATLLRHHGSLLDNLRHNKITLTHYRNDLVGFMEYQKKLVINLENLLLDGGVYDPEKTLSIG